MLTASLRETTVLRSARRSCFCRVLPVLLTVTALASFDAKAGGAPKPLVMPLDSLQGLQAKGTQPDIAEYLGRKAVHVKVTADPLPGSPLIAIKDADFQDGTIELDVAAKGLPPQPGARAPGFVGVAFRTQTDPERYEYFYIRPGNSRAADQLVRNHTVQYAAEPVFPWPVSRRQWPAVYESYVDLDPAAWIKVKIEVAGRSARLYLNGSAHPCLSVTDLRSGIKSGGVALHVGPITEAWYSNLRITPAAPVAVKSGAEVAGVWNLLMNTDRGQAEGQLKLRRDGENVSGTYSGDLGKERAVTGVWKDGFVELKFQAVWPEGNSEAETVFAGWIEGDRAGGRLRIAGRADGTWSAKPE